ncbi:DUF2171 domain-containing protein [Komagataeibacter sucrofermentans]|nr:DUF2171 domain-containing protein [Komagataeibacter sucrofermentans]GBQ48236.1 hypothetical protein AA15973_1424 [Komagataeibacter sucrofermentans DSM 15973]
MKNRAWGGTQVPARMSGKEREFMTEVTQAMLGQDVIAAGTGRMGTLTAVNADGTIQVTVDGPAESAFTIPAAWVQSADNGKILLSHTVEDVQSYTPPTN